MPKKYKNLKQLIINKKVDLLLKDGTYKTTKSNRFINSLELLLSEVNNNINKSAKLKILEIGPSYGFTTIDIYNFFDKKGFNTSIKSYEKNLFINCTRILLNIFLIYQEEYFIGFYLDSFDKFIIMTPQRRNKVLKLITKIIQRVWRIIYDHDYISSNNKKKIKLITNKIKNKSILISDNLTELKLNRFNVLICLNVLNKGYYNFEKTIYYLSEFCASLENKSYVLIGRNQKDCECSSLYLFLKKENKLKLIKRINQGWDYEKSDIYLNSLLSS